MSATDRLLIGIFIILHGLVHPIMAVVPQPVEEQTDDNPATLGGFWTGSWLLGDGPHVKFAIYALATLTALVLFAAGIGFVGPQSWAQAAWLAGAGLSLTVLVVFWNTYLVVGIIIDAVMMLAVFTTSWFAR